VWPPAILEWVILSIQGKIRGCCLGMQKKASIRFLLYST
ncbi:uncharacterized protein METZ01_LOCUS151739, partial [marine metagenome]